MSAQRVVDLPDAGGAGDQHQPLGQVAELEDLPGQPHVLGGHDLGGDDAEDAAYALAVAEEVAAEARHAGDLVGEVGVVALLELPAVPLGRHGQQDALGVGRGHGGASGKGLDLAVVAHLRRRAHAHVQVRGPHLEHGDKQLLDLGGGPAAPRTCGGRHGRRRGGGRRRERRRGRSRFRRRPRSVAAQREGGGHGVLARPGHRLDAAQAGHLPAPVGPPPGQAARSGALHHGPDVLRRLDGALHLALAGGGAEQDAAPGQEANLVGAGPRRLLEQLFQVHAS